MNYWDRPKHLDLYSLQRRRERYIVILVWKIYRGVIPNNINIIFQHSDRRGVTCLLPLGNSKYSTSINNMTFHSFSSTVAALYNAVPSEIKSIPTLTKFKAALDKLIASFESSLTPLRPLDRLGQTEVPFWSGLVAGVSNCY